MLFRSAVDAEAAQRRGVQLQGVRQDGAGVHVVARHQGDLRADDGVYGGETMGGVAEEF